MYFFLSVGQRERVFLFFRKRRVNFLEIITYLFC